MNQNYYIFYIHYVFQYRLHRSMFVEILLEISRSFSSLKAVGAVRSSLSRLKVTSARLRAGRGDVPAKITSSIPLPRILLAEFSPITQRSASSRFDFPQPLGPTTPVRPGLITSSVGSTKDLNPDSLSRLKSNFTLS